MERGFTAKDNWEGEPGIKLRCEVLKNQWWSLKLPSKYFLQQITKKISTYFNSLFSLFDIISMLLDWIRNTKLIKYTKKTKEYAIFKQISWRYPLISYFFDSEPRFCWKLSRAAAVSRYVKILSNRKYIYNNIRYIN